MTVKLILLKSGENIISNVKEGFFAEKLVCYILENPCIVDVNDEHQYYDKENLKNKINFSLHTWPELSNQTTIEVPPDWIVTIVEPNGDLKKMYETQVLGITRNENDQTDAFNEQSDSDKSD